MKKAAALVLCLLIAVCMFTACSGKDEKEGKGANGMEFNTVGDALSVDADDTSSNITENYFVYVFRFNGNTYRVTADVTKELFDEISGLDMSSEDYEEKKNELLSPLKVTKAEDISRQFMSENALKKLVGKTGADLLDDGFKVFAYYGDDGGSQIIMDRLAGEYLITFEDSKSKLDDQVKNKDIKKFRVKSAVYYGIAASSTNVN